MSALVLWFGVCPTCDNPTLLAVPGVRYLPIAGTVFAALLLGAWWLGTKYEASGEAAKSTRVWTTLWPIAALVLLFGAIFVSAFTAIAIKPCVLCTVFWAGLLLASVIASFVRLPGAWMFYLSLGSALIATYVILMTPFQYTVHGFLSPYVARLGLPPGSGWPSSLFISDVKTYVVLGNCSPCNAKSGQTVIDKLAETRPEASAVLVFEGTQSGVRVPKGMKSRILQSDQFRVVALWVDSPPFVFEVSGASVTVSEPASQYMARLDRIETTRK